MDIRALKYFQAVYEHKSVSAAARACFISQPSISSALRQLENDLNVTLFIRHPKGVSATSEGDRLYPLSKKLTGDAKAIESLFQTEIAPMAVRLGLKRSMGAERMSLLLKDMVNGSEPLELTLVTPEEPCDVRIVASTDVSAEEQFIPIWTDQYQLGLPIGHPLSLKDEIAVSDLEGLSFVYRNPCEQVALLERQVVDQGVRWNIKAHIRTIEYAHALVRAGVGAALLPDWEEITRLTDIVLRPMAGQLLKQVVGLAFLKETENLPLIRQVINAVDMHTTFYQSS